MLLHRTAPGRDTIPPGPGVETVGIMRARDYHRTLWSESPIGGRALVRRRAQSGMRSRRVPLDGVSALETNEFDPRLSQIATRWTLVFQAHAQAGPPEQVTAAQQALMHRYAGAVHRYLLGALRDPDAAADLDQEFALKFLRGEFHNANPARGRFRDFVKRAVRNLLINHQRARQRRPLALADEYDPADDAPGVEATFDADFARSWRSELLARAWDALEDLQDRTGQPYFTVLRCRVEHPEARSDALAGLLSERLGRPLTAGGVRVALMRARDRFVSFLLDEVKTSLADPTPEAIEQELIDLDLLQYCRPSTDSDQPTGGSSGSGTPRRKGSQGRR